MLTRSSERIFIPMRYTGSQNNFELLQFKVNLADRQDLLDINDIKMVFRSFMAELNSLCSNCFPIKIKYVLKKPMSKSRLTNKMGHGKLSPGRYPPWGTLPNLRLG